jgi:hypothetical protein
VKANANIHFYPSKFDKRPERERIPLLVYGYLADTRAKPIAERSTISCIATEGLDNLLAVLAQYPVIGIEAMSPKEAPGEAGKAIAIYRTKYRKGLALYAPWTHNVTTAANRAIEYRAQGIIMPGINATEMLTYLIQIGRRTDKGTAAPKTVEEHTKLLSQYAPKSPFWRLQTANELPYY